MEMVSWLFWVGPLYVSWMIEFVFRAVSMVIFGIKYGTTFRILINFLCLLMLIGFLCFVYAYRLFAFWAEGVQIVPQIPQFPFILGNISSRSHLAVKFADFYQKFKTKHRPIVGMVVLLKPVILITDLKLARSILSSENFKYFQDRGMYQNEKDDLLSAVLGSIDHDEWKKLRPKLAAAFTPAKIKRMFCIMKKVAEEFQNKLSETVGNENKVEVRGLFSGFATEIIGTAIGIPCKSPEFQRMKEKAMQPVLKYPLNIFATMYPDVARFFSVQKHSKDVSDYFIGVLKQTIEYRVNNNEHQDDFLQFLIDDFDLTTNQIVALSFDFLSAGYSDLTSTLSYCVHELSLPENQGIQKDARDEIDLILQRHDGKLTNAALNEMVLCKLIIKGKF